MSPRLILALVQVVLALVVVSPAETRETIICKIDNVNLEVPSADLPVQVSDIHLTSNEQGSTTTLHLRNTSRADSN